MLVITNPDGTETPVTVVPTEPSDSQLADGAWEWHFRRGPGSVYNKMLAAADPSLLGAVVEMRRALAGVTTAWPTVLKILREYDVSFPYAEKDGDDDAVKAMRDAVSAGEAVLSRIKEAPEARPARVWDDKPKLYVHAPPAADPEATVTREADTSADPLLALAERVEVGEDAGNG